MAYTGSRIPSEIQAIWDVILQARKAATLAIKPNTIGSIPDKAAREIIIAAGYEQAIMHRTGHNIDSTVHGKGANLDSYEMTESRLLLPNLVVSVEPGLYFPEQFGVRSEINVAITNTRQRVTTPTQKAILCI